MKVRLTQTRCADGRDERLWLRENKDYLVLAIECDWYRLLNEYGEPTLHAPECFEITDRIEPIFWVKEVIDDCVYAGPPELQGRGLCEQWFDDVQEAIKSFNEVILKYYPEAKDDLSAKRARKSDDR